MDAGDDNDHNMLWRPQQGRQVHTKLWAAVVSQPTLAAPCPNQAPTRLLPAAGSRDDNKILTRSHRAFHSAPKPQSSTRRPPTPPADPSGLLRALNFPVTGGTDGKVLREAQ